MHETHNKTYHKHTYIPQVEGVDRKPADKIEENYQTESNIYNHLNNLLSTKLAYLQIFQWIVGRYCQTYPEDKVQDVI